MRVSATEVEEPQAAPESPQARFPRRDEASLPERLRVPMPSSGIRGWIGPIIVTIIGGLLRLVDLGRPHALIFDETYYPKDALGLLQYGYEQKFVENANDLILESDGNWRALDLFTSDPAFVVHPPLGKWTIALGEQLFGATPFGWRFAVAVLGTLSILHGCAHHPTPDPIGPHRDARRASPGRRGHAPRHEPHRSARHDLDVLDPGCLRAPVDRP